MYAKNEKQLQVRAFRDQLSSEPRRLLKVSINHKNRYQLLCDGFEMLRAFGRMDKGAIKLNAFRTL